MLKSYLKGSLLKKLIKKDTKNNRVDLSGIVYEYKDLGKIHKCNYENKIYNVVTKRGEKYILNLEYMDKYFVDNHLKNTLDYLKNLQK